MNRAVLVIMLCTCLSCRNADTMQKQESIDSKSSEQEVSIVSDAVLDSMYNYAYEVLHGDVKDPNYELAKRSLQQCAKMHDSRCATLLGYHLVKGFRFEKDAQLGLLLLKEAAKLNDFNAILFLSDYYYENAEVDSSIVLLEKAHANGHSEATYLLAEMYLKGVNVRLGRPEVKYTDIIDVEKGLEYLEDAAEEVLEAKFSLANYYLKGGDNRLNIDTSKSVLLLKEILSSGRLDSIPGLRDRVEMRLDEVSRF